jgi:adenylate kinase family enzyme
LDSIFWDNSSDEYGIKAPVTVRDNKLKQFVEQPSWVIEGVYYKWLESSFTVADTIFILNTPFSIQEERIWSRYENRKAGISPSAKKETIKSVEKLIEWNKKYNQEFLPNFVRNNEYSNKIILLDYNENIFNFLG